MNNDHHQGEEKEIHYEVNGEPQVTREHKLTPVQIMQRANIDPTKNYLLRLDGNEKKSFKDEPEKELPIHEGERFITNFCGPKPVS